MSGQTGLNMKKLAKACAVVALVGVVAGCAKQGAFEHLSSDKKASEFNAELGASYLAAGELENAELKIERALQQDPSNALALNTSGKLRAALDQPQAADRAFQRSIRLDLKRAEYRNNYGIFLCDQGRTKEAIAQFVAAAENKFYRTPEFALDNAGVCALGARQYVEADTYLRSAIRMNPNFPPSLLHMAELKLKSGDAELADAYYSRFLSLGRQSPRSLATGIEVKRAVGDGSAADNYAQQLITNFPRSSQARTFLASS